MAFFNSKGTTEFRKEELIIAVIAAIIPGEHFFKTVVGIGSKFWTKLKKNRRYQIVGLNFVNKHFSSFFWTKLKKNRCYQIVGLNFALTYAHALFLFSQIE